MRLNKQLVVQRALDLVHEIGLEKLTTRRLGEELGVEGPALYRHFKSKNELLDHMAAAILLPVITTHDSEQSWDEWLLSLGQRSLAAVMQYRDGAKIVASALPTNPYNLLSKPLHQAGFSAQEAVYASKLITRFMVGWQLHEDNEIHRRDRAEPRYDHQKAFDFAFGTLIDGLRARLEKKQAGKKNRTAQVSPTTHARSKSAQKKVRKVAG